MTDNTTAEESGIAEAVRFLYLEGGKLSGADYIREMVKKVAEMTGTRYSFVMEVQAEDRNRARSVAFWDGRNFSQIEIPIPGTPCEVIREKGESIFRSGLLKLFPEAKLLKKLKAESYIGEPLIDSRGNFLGMMAVIDTKPIQDPRPITAIFRAFALRSAMELERMQREGKLQETYFWLNESQRISQIGSYVLDVKTGTWNSSETLDKILGIPPKEKKNFEDWASLIHPEEQKEMISYFQDQVLGARKKFDRVYRIIRPSDGEVRWLHGLGKLTLNEKKAVEKMVGTIQDITELKEREEQLLSEKEKFKTIFENVNDAIFIINPDASFVDINEMAAKVHGYTREELKRLKLFQLISPAVAFDPEKRFRRIIQDGSGFFESVHRRKDGSDIPVEISARIVRYDHFPVMLYVMHDISAAKRAVEEASRFSQIFEKSLNEIYIFDRIRLNFIQVNDAARKNLGYSMEELRAMTPLDLKPEFTLQSFNAMLAPLRMGTKEGIVFHTVHRRKDGSLYPVEVHLQLLRFDSVKAFVAMILDVSERARAEKIARESLARLKESQKVAHVGTWVLDVPSGKLEWSEEIFRIFEVDPEKFAPSYEKFLGIIHPEDRSSVDRAYRQSLKEKTPYDITHRLLLPDGRIKFVRERCETHFDAKGVALRSVGTIQDITEQKKNEIELDKKISQVEHFNKFLVNRELRMIELKKEVERLKTELERQQ